MKPFWRSMTLQSAVLLFLSSAPGLSAPIWDTIATAGLPPEWVARLQVAAYALGGLGVVLGRVRAQGPVKLV